MKQGTGRTTNEGKREPISHSISPGAVSRLGTIVGPGTPFKSLQGDDGVLRAPMASHELHLSGSQGKHK